MFLSFGSRDFGAYAQHIKSELSIKRGNSIINKILTKDNLIKILGKGLDILYPPRCILCDNLLNAREIRYGFCNDCSDIINSVRGAVCFKCGRPMDLPVEYCRDCRRHNHSYIQGRGIFEYNSLREAMYRFKYSNRRDYAAFFAEAAIRYNGDWLREIAPDMIIPVPMYRRKKKKRGYNQAEIFGRALSRTAGIPCREDIIYRVRDTMPLKTLTAAERQTKLADAFECRQMISKDIRILLVDDIYTTGSTVDEVSKMLIKSGAKDIYCLYVCIGSRKEENFYGS